MGKYDKLKARNQQITISIKNDASHYETIANEYNRIADIYQAPAVIFSSIERDFRNSTNLDDVDISFLFFAIALQCIRQYFMTFFKDPDERPTDKESADNTWGHGQEHSDRGNFLYNPSLKEIIENPVPFDAIFGGKDFGIGLGGNNHRFKTLGHDPILGWLFGTANIATNTITMSDFRSFHVSTGHTKRGDARDKITRPANTLEIFRHVIDKMVTREGRWSNYIEENRPYSENRFAGPSILAASVIKEAIHLKSDVNSKESLPFPIISTISCELAQNFAKYGFDMCNILSTGKQFSYATLINFLIATIHRMCFDVSSGLPLSLYEVKTRKILTYSNIIASGSNVIAVAVTEAMALSTENEELMIKGAKYFDIGGLEVTLFRLINDHEFIKNVKLEFLNNHWYSIVLGDDYAFTKEE